MKQRVPISNIMASVVIAVPTTKKLSEVDQLLLDYNIRHIPVVQGNKLVGIISKNDLLKIGYSQQNMDQAALMDIYDAYELTNIMTVDPVVVSEDTSIKDVAQIFAQQHFHSLPVVNKENELVGIVTTTDLIQYLVDQY